MFQRFQGYRAAERSNADYFMITFFLTQKIVFRIFIAAELLGFGDYIEQCPIIAHLLLVGDDECVFRGNCLAVEAI